MSIYQRDDKRGALASLRALIPERRLTFDEALRVAELQANRMLEILQIDDAPIPDEVITELPRIAVRRRSIPTSGLSYWDGSYWIIALNRSEPTTRQRFTLFHEYKHIIDHGRTERLYAGANGRTTAQQGEHAADYFAGCLLMPRKLLKRAWCGGLQTPAQIARQFAASERAATVRLTQIGLIDHANRCEPRVDRPLPGRRIYYRALSPNWPTARRQESLA